MLQEAESLLNEVYANSLQPQRHDLTVSQWADENRVLSGKAASEPGRWRTSRTPYLKEPMDEMSVGSPTERVVLMFGSQLGKTEALNNTVGYTVDYAPAPILMVQPTLGMVKKTSKQRISPMIKESPSLTDKFSAERSREGSNTLFEKEFDNGILLLATSGSASELASMPIKVVLLDETDRYDKDVKDEGDPIELAETRTSTFRNRKICLTSTPTIAGDSNIEAEYEDSTQAVYDVPCPHCHEKQVLKFENLKWDEGKPETAQYVCEHCGTFIEERHKTWILENGEWRHRKPEAKAKGYWLNSLYSPLGFLSWSDIVLRFLKAKGKPNKLKVFVNTLLAETWDDKGEAPDYERLYKRRENYTIGIVPKGALFLTAGVDIQHDRIELEVVGWGRDLRSWSIDYRVYKGDTSQPEVWDKFWSILNEGFPHEEGATLKLRQIAVDSGDQTQMVYNQVRKQSDQRVMAIKGNDNLIVPYASPKDVDINIDGRKIYRGTKLWGIGTSLLKVELFDWLKQEAPIDDEPYPYGFCHFPQYSKDHFRGLASESRKKKTTKGKARYEWVKHFERNEPLDCRIYARAAASVFGIDRFVEKHWQQLEASVKEEETPEQTTQRIKRRKGTWL